MGSAEKVCIFFACKIDKLKHFTYSFLPNIMNGDLLEEDKFKLFQILHESKRKLSRPIP